MSATRQDDRGSDPSGTESPAGSGAPAGSYAPSPPPVSAPVAPQSDQ
jgi:hypothetical protein